MIFRVDEMIENVWLCECRTWIIYMGNVSARQLRAIDGAGILVMPLQLAAYHR